MRVSVILVSYNTKELLRAALSSITDQHEIIVVDNASTDGSAEMVESEFPTAKLIRNDRNVGFGAANNQGMEAASGDLVLLLNSDARPVDDAISQLARLFDETDIVAAGGKLTHPNGSLQESACTELTLWAVFCEQTLLEKVFPRSSFFSSYWQSARLLKNGAGPHEVAQVMGACLMMRPVARFDERFFLYCEDTELCYRLRKHGRIVYDPRSIFVHELGASSQSRWEAVARYNRGKELYFQIHHGRAQAFFCWFFNRIGAFKRVMIWLLATTLTLGTVGSFRNRLILFLRVLFAPISGPQLPADTR
ncbi:glycosyltransferase family 2 protein [Kamptonema cortianum]|nr:glycosyltransferase family 2 protein [Geitlerinema splendidum]MDK3155957.1 glycosyltransferase family 2 protein [Kamptonema cortianum]